MRSTHTFVELELTEQAFDEIAEKLREQGDYDHKFIDKHTIDMYGLAVTRGKPINAEKVFGAEQQPNIVETHLLPDHDRA